MAWEAKGKSPDEQSGEEGWKAPSKRRGPKGNLQGSSSASELGLLSLRVRESCRPDEV